MQFTKPTQIDKIVDKTTKNGKPFISFITHDKQWFNCFTPGDAQHVKELHGQAALVVIGYEMNGQYTDFKNINHAGQDTPQEAQDAPQSTVGKDESIARAVALKAAVELLCSNGKWHTEDRPPKLEDLADQCLAWLKNEKPAQPSVSNGNAPDWTQDSPPEDDISLDEIPF